jgi:hypothetical protein
MKRVFWLGLVLAVSVAACTQSPTQPDPAQPDPAQPTPTQPAPTRFIVLGGNLEFGGVAVGSFLDRVLLIRNVGNDTLQITGTGLILDDPRFNAECLQMLRPLSTTEFAVAPSQEVSVGFRFQPLSNINCSGRISVSGNQTTGISTRTVSAYGFIQY